MNFTSKIKFGMSLFCKNAIESNVDNSDLLKKREYTKDKYNICFPMCIYFARNFSYFETPPNAKAVQAIKKNGLDFIESHWLNCIGLPFRIGEENPQWNNLSRLFTSIDIFYETKTGTRADAAKQFIQNTFGESINVREEPFSISTSTNIINDVRPDGSFDFDNLSLIGFNFKEKDSSLNIRTLAHVMFLLRYGANVYLIEPAKGVYRVDSILPGQSEGVICEEAVSFFLRDYEANLPHGYSLEGAPIINIVRLSK